MRVGIDNADTVERVIVNNEEDSIEDRIIQS